MALPQITKVKGKFPDKAIITQSSATMNDMGDKSISMQVQIQDLKPDDFAYDWEVEFQGERYIHAIREPQASKGNDSICSIVDLTFQHWTIYQLRRYYYFKTANVGSGVVSADNYIASLSGGFSTFLSEFEQVIKHHYDDTIKVALYGTPNDYDQTAQYIEINYSHIWDVLQKMYEVYGVRWNIKGDTIYVGYPTEEIAHQFEYGFEGGLLKVERQVQSTDIRNSLLGRGGSKNLPYRYFKNVDEHSPSFKADPDWIPELENIYFTELRGKTFRDYVKGWKAKHYDGEPMTEPTEAYTKGYTDEKFNPIEFVEDKESIRKYDLLQGGLENQEDIYPSIQGVEVDGIGRVDEVVGAERVTVDESSSEESLNNSSLIPITVAYTTDEIHKWKDETLYTIRTDTYKVSKGRQGVFLGWYSIKASERAVKRTDDWYGTGYTERDEIVSTDLECKIVSYKLYDANTNNELTTSIISDDVSVYAEIQVSARGFFKNYDNTYVDPWAGQLGEQVMFTDEIISIDIEGGMSDVLIHGIILDNYQDGQRISQSISIANEGASSLILQTLEFEVPENGATNVDVPINIVTSQDAQGLYEWQRTRIEAVNVDTNEVVSSINIPQGRYYLRITVEIRNIDSKTHTYEVELMPSYIYYPIDTDEFKPKFDIWVKNIWNTTRNEGESDIAYMGRVWTPILGDREGDTAKIVFTTGLLSGHSDYEFEIIDVAYAGNEGVEFGGVSAEWRITLAKSTAELEATGKYIPSTQIQAEAGNYFYFIGIDMPHEYVLWAEERLDQRKADKLLETANIKPTWVVQTDKVRLNQVQPHESKPLLDAIKVGNSIRLADTRFIKGAYENLFIQSVTYSWQSDTVLLPNIEIVLSDKVATSLNPVAQIQGQIDSLTKQVGSLSNVQQVVRAIGDKLYLRKDGVDESSNSITTFNKQIQSKDYRQGAIGGKGWGMRTEQGKGVLELDKIIVREEMQVNSLVVNQVSAIGGKEILSAASITCSRVETTERGFKCYFDQKRGSIANLFQVNDIAYSQVFNANDIEVKYYKREVIEVGDNYILLSLDSGDNSNGAPQEGDVIAQYGNTKVPERQHVIIRDVIGGGYERMLCGLDSIDSNGIEYFFAGRMEGDTPRWFVGDSNQYVKFEKGKIQIECKQVGMTSEGEDDDAIRIWAGADNTDKGNAPFRVLQDGRVIATEAEIAGTVNANSGTFNNGKFNNVTIKGSISNPVASYIGASIQIMTDEEYYYTYYRQNNDDLDGLYAWYNSGADIETIYTQSTKPITNDVVFDNSGNAIDGYKITSYTNIIDGEKGLNRHDNVAIPLVSDRVLYADELSWDVSNSGRLIRLINASYGDLATEGKVLMYAPSGQYFYEDGERYSQLLFSREVIELFGYGTETQFYGWLVLNRGNVQTTKSYGAPQPILYQGTIDKNVLTKFWSAKYVHAADLKGAFHYPSTGVVQILVNEVGKNAIDDYRGLNNVNNWTVIASGATVISKAYVQSTFDGVTYNCIEFNLDYTNTNYVTFQVISTADWAKLT